MFEYICTLFGCLICGLLPPSLARFKIDGTLGLSGETIEFQWLLNLVLCIPSWYFIFLRPFKWCDELIWQYNKLKAMSVCVWLIGIVGFRNIASYLVVCFFRDRTSRKHKNNCYRGKKYINTYNSIGYKFHCLASTKWVDHIFKLRNRRTVNINLSPFPLAILRFS